MGLKAREGLYVTFTYCYQSLYDTVAPFLRIQLQTRKMSCNSEPDFMLFALALQIVSV